MVVAMRLMRMGTTHRPIYRISVADSRRAPTGKFLEHIGTYDPNLDKMGNKQLRLNVARAKYWIAMGCQPSSVVARLLARFHLLPLPPQRNTVITGPLLHAVLAGEDVRHRIPTHTDAVHVPVEHPSDQPKAHPTLASNRYMKEVTPKRKEQLQRQAKWKLQTWPFEYQPTTATQAAWDQARKFHGVKKIATPMEEMLAEARVRWAEMGPEAVAASQVILEGALADHIEAKAASARSAEAAEFKESEEDDLEEGEGENDAVDADDAEFDEVSDIADVPVAEKDLAADLVDDSETIDLDELEEELAGQEEDEFDDDDGMEKFEAEELDDVDEERAGPPRR